MDTVASNQDPSNRDQAGYGGQQKGAGTGQAGKIPQFVPGSEPGAVQQRFGIASDQQWEQLLISGKKESTALWNHENPWEGLA